MHQDPRLHPIQIMADSAGYSDIVFGLFALLGYRFSPRLADLGKARFWRIDPTADYGPLNGIARQRVHVELIRHHWEDLLRLAGSLQMGTVPANEVVRLLQGGGHPTTLGRAVGEIGRIAKSFHLLSVIDDPVYRRGMLLQLNRGEARHSLARDTFFGQKGEVRQPYREGQEEQLGALGFVVNLIVVWNTLYMDLTLNTLRMAGREVRPEDVERLSRRGMTTSTTWGSIPLRWTRPFARVTSIPCARWKTRKQTTKRHPSRTTLGSEDGVREDSSPSTTTRTTFLFHYSPNAESSSREARLRLLGLGLPPFFYTIFSAKPGWLATPMPHHPAGKRSWVLL